MLRAFRMETGMADAHRLKAILMKLMGFLFPAGAILIMCGTRFAFSAAPLGMAFFASAMMCGKNLPALIAGGLASSPVIGTGLDLSVPVGMAIILGGDIAWTCAGKRLRRGHSPPLSERMMECSVLAGLATLLPGLISANGEIWPSAQVCCAAVAGAAGAPFMFAAMCAGFERKFPVREERLGFGIMTCALVSGLAGIYPPLAAFGGSIAVLCAHPCGGGLGVAAGAGAVAAGADGGLFAMIAVGGLASQLASEGQRHVRAMGAVLASLAAAVFTGASLEIAAGACLGGMAYIIMPGKWAKRAADISRSPAGAWDPDRLAAQLNRRAVQRLNALGAAFGELAEGYLQPCTMPDEQALMAGMRARLCSGCGDYGACWGGEGNHGARFLCGLISEAVEWADLNGQAPLFEDEVPPDIMRRCRRGRMVSERLSELLEDFVLKRRAELKRGGENRLISAQFIQARQMIESIADEQSRPVRLRDRQAARAAAVLEQAGLPLENIMMLGSPGTEIIAELKEGRWTRDTAAMASARLSRAFGRVYAPEGEPGREMRFVRRPGYRVETGAGCLSRDAGVPSGDSHTMCMIDDERMLFLICDGMGSGEEAARESAMAVRLLTRFLKAGADTLLAIETVNALLLNSGGDDMFATVDMLILDLSTGMAEFVKLAACPSLIARNGEIHRVEGGRLPLGILEKVRPAISRIRLLPGDIVLMASDGVMDAVDMRRLKAGMRDAPGDMRDLARQVLDMAEDTGHTCRRDDMTCVCARFGARAA